MNERDREAWHMVSRMVSFLPHTGATETLIVAFASWGSLSHDMMTCCCVRARAKSRYQPPTTITVLQQ